MGKSRVHFSIKSSIESINKVCNFVIESREKFCILGTLVQERAKLCYAKIWVNNIRINVEGVGWRIEGRGAGEDK